MLVLGRRLKEKLYIDHNGERLTITVVSLYNREVKLAFDGSKKFNIKRDDIIKKKSMEDLEADDNV